MEHIKRTTLYSDINKKVYVSYFSLKNQRQFLVTKQRRNICNWKNSLI